MKKTFTLPLLLIGCSSFILQAEDVEEKELQDMSDPLAVYTQAGVGTANKGLFLKVGKSYDPGTPKTMAMNIFEVHGIYGEVLGWDSKDNQDNSIDSIRFRNFKVDMTDGRGSQVDINYKFDANHLAEQSGDASYSLIQALPKMSIFNLYPLAGVGASFGNNIVEDDGRTGSGYSVNGTFGLIGMYGKVTVTDKLWLNYNPFWLTTFSGSNHYKDNAYGENNSSVFTHEFIASYQFNPRLNVRYFANWNQNVNFNDGDHRIEVNYQL